MRRKHLVWMGKHILRMSTMKKGWKWKQWNCPCTTSSHLWESFAITQTLFIQMNTPCCVNAGQARIPLQNRYVLPTSRIRKPNWPMLPMFPMFVVAFHLVYFSQSSQLTECFALFHFPPWVETTALKGHDQKKNLNATHGSTQTCWSASCSFWHLLA